MTTFSHAALSLCVTLALLGHAWRANAQAAEPPRREARVVFETSPEHLALYRTSLRSTAYVSGGGYSASGEQRDYQRVCVAPCEVTLPAGTETYAVARTDGQWETDPRPIGIITLPPGTSTARIDYRNRAAIRTIGHIIGLGASLGGLVYSAVQVFRYTECENDTCKKSHRDGALVGAGFIAGGFAISLVVGSIDDGVDVKITPRALPPGAQLPRARQLALRGSF